MTLKQIIRNWLGIKENESVPKLLLPYEYTFQLYFDERNDSYFIQFLIPILKIEKQIPLKFNCDKFTMIESSDGSIVEIQVDCRCEVALDKLLEEFLLYQYRNKICDILKGF